MKTFFVKANWDPEAGVFWSESDVPGLVVETRTLDEFMSLVQEFTPEMLQANMPAFKGPYRVQFVAERELRLEAA